MHYVLLLLRKTDRRIYLSKMSSLFHGTMNTEEWTYPIVPTIVTNEVTENVVRRWRLLFVYIYALRHRIDAYFCPGFLNAEYKKQTFITVSKKLI